MKSIEVITALVLASIPAFVNAQGPVQNRGTDVMHYSVREPFVVEPGFAAEGRAYLTCKEQGNSQKQTADLFLRQLDASGSYLLFVVVGDSPESTYVTNFSADTRGRANVRFRSHGNSSKRLPLPDIMSPITGIRELIITTADTQTVARVTFAAPDKMSYLVKRSLGTQNVDSILRLKANHRVARLKWVIYGLEPTTAYGIELNDVVTESVTSDEYGRIIYDRPFADPYEALDLRSIYLQDAAENVIIGTELP